MGMWIIRPDEPQESVEDPMGLERPVDRDAEAAPEELADALADLPETRVIATPNAPREVLTSEGPVPRGQRPTTTGASGIGHVYPEWDCRAQAYRLQGKSRSRPATASGPRRPSSGIRPWYGGCEGSLPGSVRGAVESTANRMASSST